ncbi:MAG: oxidoreductase, partial [Bdellovibrionaceae bacterium]|nr:oxidoreductase [Pseudobdellovibrionaceae bacterium]
VPVASGGWEVVAPSAIPFSENYPKPREMNRDDMQKVIFDFVGAAKRSLTAGFEVIELHLAHGYLLHQFLSPLSNTRTDKFGGTLENRMRFPLEVTNAVRKVWPDHLPLFARISATDWAYGPDELKAIAEKRTYPDGSWTLKEAVLFAKELKKSGVDLIDCTTGGIIAKPQIPAGPNYQVPFSEVIRREAGIATAAVGMITDPVQAEGILLQQQADAIFMAREFLRDPYFPRTAAQKLGAQLPAPKQYLRSWG